MRSQQGFTPSWKRAATALLASTIIATPALAQEVAPTDPAQAPSAAPTAPAQAPSVAPNEQQGEEIIVTATKRAEALQDVPMAIQAFSTKTLDDLQVDAFDDYAKLVPSLSYKSAGPGSSNVYFRGVASGENANHSTSLPSVGTYLDEQPITTIQGALDIHVFDIARVEALAGPQGTLYGASSEAGTIRIITNKPDFNGTYGQVNLELNKVAHGDWGYTGEGFINLPITSSVAARVVGWYRHDAGYIDNIHGQMNYPEYVYDAELGEPVATGNTIVRDNAPWAEDDYNDVTTYGARAALKIDLNDNWTITPQFMAQNQTSNGSFSEESGLGKLETMQFQKEKFTDNWWQGALTVEGKIGNFDITYAGAHMWRDVDGISDYSDYSYFYDAFGGYGAYWYDNDYNPIDPTQYIISDDTFKKDSHELRITSPADKRLRLVAGLFYQRQEHNIEQHYIIDGLADFLEVSGQTDNIWLTKQIRVDRDYAAFGEVSFDILPQLTVTGGGRFYKFDNTLEGFFGYQFGGYSSNPDYQCDGPPIVDGSPCTNLDKGIKDTGFVHRLNATWKPNEDMLFYATWSRGFRPGGLNRRGSLPPFDPDFLSNYELGAKISFGRGSHFNFALYQEDWTDIQLSFLGANGLTEVRNAGDARIRGFEADLFLRPMDGLTWSTGVSFNDAKMRTDFCYIVAPDCLDPDFGNLGAEKGTRLPLTAKWKGNSRVRYEWNAWSDVRANVQANISYEGARTRDIREAVQDIYGKMDAYTLVDLGAGLEKGPWSVDLFVKNLFDARGQISKGIQCNEFVCGDPFGASVIGPKIYTTVTRPRTIGLRVGRKF
jgi:outer membrane receptor protein involved in Fe transport